AAFAVRLGLTDSNTNTNANPDCRASIGPAEIKAAPTKAAEMVTPALEQAKGTDQATAKTGAAKTPFGPPVTPPVPAPSPRAVLASAGKAPPAAAPTAAAIAAEAREIEVRKSEVHLIDPVSADDSKPQVLASAS